MEEKVFNGAGIDPKTKSSKYFYILNPVIRIGRDAFETITQRYNASKGYTQLLISFEDTFLSVEQQKALEKKITDLPKAIKSHILKLVVTGSELEPGNWARGVTYRASNDIWLRNFVEREFTVPTDQDEKIISLSVPQPFDLFDNFLHELGHAIDNMSGTRVYDYLAYQPDDGKIKQDLKNRVQPTVRMNSMSRLSYSDEFLKVFEEFFLNKEDVWEYIRWTPSEAWADSLGEYINKKLNGVAYTRYKKIGDTVYSYNPAYAGLNPEYDAMKETVYDVGYSPVEASEWYWESMYQKLFVPQILKEIVVDKVETKTRPAQNGKILVGTKPKVQVEVLPYRTIYIADETKDYGYRIEVGGVDGQKITTTTYVLIGQEAQANEPTVRQEAAIDKVITLGTKAKQAQVNLVEVRTVYLDDQSLEVGTELEKQAGSQGYTMRTVTYRLNPETGELTETVTDVVTPMVERIVLRGSKSVLVVETEVLSTVKDNLNPLPKAEVVQTLHKDPVTTAEQPIVTATVSKFDQGTTPSSSKEIVLPKTGSTSGLALSLLGTVLFALGLARKKEVEQPLSFKCLQKTAVIGDQKKMKKYSALGLLLTCSLLLGACQSNQSQATASSSTEQSSSQTKTKQTQSTSSTDSSSSQVKSSKASSSSSTEQSSSQAETKESSSEIKKAKELDYDQLYAETLTKIKADPENKVSHYAFYDIDGNGTKELLTGLGSDKPGAVAIYYIKNGVSTYLAHSEVQPVGGGRAAFRINSDGTVTQVHQLSQNGEGTQTTYKLAADNSGTSVVEEKPFKFGQNVPADLGLDLTNFDWQPLSVSVATPEAAKEMNLDAIRAGDYSSLYGTWAKPNGETIVFDASSFGTGNNQIHYVKDLNGSLMFGYNLPSGGLSFIPKGVEFGDTDSSRDRYNPIHVSAGYVHESTYYRVDQSFKVLDAYNFPVLT